MSEQEQQSAELWVRHRRAAFIRRRAGGRLASAGAAWGWGLPQDSLLPSLPHRAAMEVMNMMEQPIKVTEWQQTYTYDSGIHSGVNTQVPSVSSKCLGDDEELYGKQYTIKKTTTTSYCQGGSQSQSQAQGMGCGTGHACGFGCSAPACLRLPQEPCSFWALLHTPRAAAAA